MGRISRSCRGKTSKRPSTRIQSRTRILNRRSSILSALRRRRRRRRWADLSAQPSWIHYLAWTTRRNTKSFQSASDSRQGCTLRKFNQILLAPGHQKPGTFESEDKLNGRMMLNGKRPRRYVITKRKNCLSPTSITFRSPPIRTPRSRSRARRSVNRPSRLRRRSSNSQAPHPRL